VIAIGEQDLRRRMSLDEISQTLRRTVLDTAEVRGLRWELLFGYSVQPCTDMHQLVFGADSLHLATMAEARRRLVRWPSDSVLFAIAERTTERPVNTGSRSGVARVNRPFGRAVSAITGHRQIEACLSLFGYR
jgi:hypothetical protein